ncbi:MAG TPA: glucosamine-6-phosphate deaminase [Candidatus Latescibacteria bacterium]|nr:glucosamine-6-phosphate deaminase [Candidatus Latescibacterota bacterium]HJP33220.1 glucosamine-6-phosphate deaminase [Candidatus Latescibacterota bacterium]
MQSASYSTMSADVDLTPVERAALEASPFGVRYTPEERISTLVVDNFPALGKLAALRFLEWVQVNPEGVVSLPTGKTPEHFIKWVQRLLGGWDSPEIRAELEAGGIDPAHKPDMAGLHFVQIDEFYPIDPTHANSFHAYVQNFYLKGFGLRPERALLMDCRTIGLHAGQTLQSVWGEVGVDLSLRYRAAASHTEQMQKDVLSRVDQWCQEYEDSIRALGGIGFFLGGIGPDGHIGFNVKGSDHRSTTRLTEVNYETQASAAGDLGGIEVARRCLVITIGVGTIADNPEATAIIMAAGEAKAHIVADAIQQEPNIDFPATGLQQLPMARFYITSGAAKLLGRRRLELLEQSAEIDDATAERILVDLAASRRTKLVDLTDDDLAGDAEASVLLRQRQESRAELTTAVCDSLVAKIERGSQTLTDTRFLHTEPHHDDLMLGYLPYIVRHTRSASNTHYFSCLTGGFTAVTNAFVVAHIERLAQRLDGDDFGRLLDEGYFEPDSLEGRNRDVWQYLDGVAARSADMRDEGAARRLLRNLIAIHGDRDRDAARTRLDGLRAYFASRHPGQKDSQDVQQLKAMSREWEAECLWGYFGWDCSHILHLRLGFYTGDIFTPEPTVDKDVLPVIDLLQRTNPDVVSVALDPEASGPDTHYKVLQSIAEALRRYEKDKDRPDIRVWGYRNVWFRFHPSEANIFVPVSLNMFAIMHASFMNSFVSQAEASFPSPEHDGPFSELAQRVQVEQYEKIKICLGREWFHEHPSPLIRGTRGLVFVNEMELSAFYERSRELRQAAEAG